MMALYSVSRCYRVVRSKLSGTSDLKKSLLAVFLLIVATLVTCALPLTSVATLTLSVTDQTGRKITGDASATFLDAARASIVRVTPQWDNHIHWWSHSSHASSTLRPADAQRAVSARVEAKDCEPQTVPVVLQRRYQPPSVMPHGGGPAYYHYTFERAVVLRCR